MAQIAGSIVMLVCLIGFAGCLFASHARAARGDNHGQIVQMLYSTMFVIILIAGVVMVFQHA